MNDLTARHAVKPVIVTVVGVGALGSHLLLFGRNLPDVAWGIIDHDRVEQANLAGQFHTRMGAGRNKAEAARVAMLGMFGTRVDAFPHRLIESNANALIGGSSLVVDCVDNGETRRLIQTYTRVRNIPCLHGALGDGIGRAVWNRYFTVDDAPQGVPTCADGGNLPLIAATGALLARVIQLWLVDGQRVSAQTTGLDSRVVASDPAPEEGT